MAQGITTAFWGMTINNYDDNELALVRNGYPDYMREIIHTLEVGKKGTPHIQAWIKLQRQQRLSFVKKLFPRAKFIPLTSDQYVRNTKDYAQKQDDTAVAPSVHKFNDPFNTIESVMKKVIRRMYDDYPKVEDIDVAQRYVQKAMVKEDYKYAKIFVSSTYKQMWKEYGNEMYQCLFDEFEKQLDDEHTHTHTHSDENLSREGGITDDGEDEQDSQGDSQSDDEGEDAEGEDYEDDSSGEDSGRDESDDDEYS